MGAPCVPSVNFLNEWVLLTYFPQSLPLLRFYKFLMVHQVPLRSALQNSNIHILLPSLVLLMPVRPVVICSLNTDFSLPLRSLLSSFSASLPDSQSNISILDLQRFCLQLFKSYILYATQVPKTILLEIGDIYVHKASPWPHHTYSLVWDKHINWIIKLVNV